MGLSFGSYMRCRRDVLMRRRGFVPLRRRWVFHLSLVWDVMKTYHWDVLATFHWDIVGCFIWDLFEMSWRRTTETSWRRSIETSLGVSFETCLRRCWDIQSDVITTSPQRLVAGWVVISQKSFKFSGHDKISFQWLWNGWTTFSTETLTVTNKFEW